MATSGLIETKINQGADIAGTNAWGKFEWARANYSNSANTTTVNWSVHLNLQWGIYPASANTSYRKVRVIIDGVSNDYIAAYNGAGAGNYTQLLTGSTTVQHNADGTKTASVIVYISERSSFSSSSASYDDLSRYYSAPVSGSMILDPIRRKATILTATNFNDEENPTITFDNPAGAAATSLQACISFTGAKDDIVYRDIPKTLAAPQISLQYTFELTDAERKVLRQGITKGSSTTVRFYVRSTVDGVTYHSYLTRNLYLTNFTPTLSPSIEDVNSRTLSLTGDKNKFIRYHSNAKVTFGAAARKEASVESRSVICGSQTIEIEDRGQDTATINGVDSNTYYLTVTDTRGHTTKSAPTKTLIPYVRLTNNLKTAALTATGNLEVTVSGKYFDGSFGAKSNTMEIEYSVRDDAGNYVTNPSGSGWQPLGLVNPAVDDDNNYTYSFTITGLDYTKTYTLTVNAIDELTPVQTSTKVIASVPVFDWDKDDFNFNVPVTICDRTRITNEGQIHGTTRDGITIQAIDPCNNNNNLVIGYGSYGWDSLKTPDGQPAGTNIYGGSVKFYSKNGFKFNEATLADFVVEQNSNGIWYYRKWNSGRVELYGYQYISKEPCDVALGSMYRTAEQVPPNFPFTVNNPKAIASFGGTGTGAFVYFTQYSATTKPPNYYLVRPTSSASTSGEVNFTVTGTWK